MPGQIVKKVQHKDLLANPVWYSTWNQLSVELKNDTGWELAPQRGYQLRDQLWDQLKNKKLYIIMGLDQTTRRDIDTNV